MKKAALIFGVLLGVFLVAWNLKSKTPNGRPTSYSDNDSDWWQNSADIEVDEEWILDPSIPTNYIPVSGKDDLYMVVDTDGNITQYMQRTLQDDGKTYSWKKINPDIPDNYEPVKGHKNVYKVTNKDGSVTYLKYIRNDDNTYAFVEVDKNGKLKIDNPKTDKIPENYKEESGNTYAVYDDNNVKVGYVSKNTNKDGSFTWTETTKPTKTDNITQIDNETTTKKDTSTVQEQTTTAPTQSVIGNGSSIETETSKNVNKDKTYTETKTIKESKTSGGWTITYETVITMTYSSDGILLTSSQDGPNEISRVKAVTSDDTPDPSLIEANLDDELTRVSSKVKYDTKLADEVLSLLNAERTESKLSKLTMKKDSIAYKVAQILASDMAVYNHSDYDSPMYGTLEKMLTKFKISYKVTPSKNIWKTTPKTAEEINQRLQVIESARDVRMGKQYSQIGIAIVSKNGYYYIVEVLFE